MKKSIAIFFCIIITETAMYAQESKEKQPPPPPPPPIIEVVKFVPPVIVTEELEEFYKRNPSVDEIRWKSNHQVIVVFKDKEKKTESYNLSDKDEESAFTAKYGEAPKPVPPPPPPPPKKKKA